MGVLGTNLTSEDTTKIVVVKVIDAEDCYEIARVYGNNEDFDVICTAPLKMPAHFCKKAVNHYLQQPFNKKFSLYTCKISHNKSVMSMEEAFERILTATEQWKG